MPIRRRRPSFDWSAAEKERPFFPPYALEVLGEPVVFGEGGAYSIHRNNLWIS